jgi:DNA-binding MarR family transcriptional regulator
MIWWIFIYFNFQNEALMNKTVELVKMWGDFEEKHPSASLEDFFRYQLTRSREGATPKTPLEEQPLPMESRLMIIIGKIARMHTAYANIALQDTGLSQIEEFGILITIHRQAEDPKKTEVIQSNIIQLSSGTNMLERLKKKGLLKEYDDPVDRRSKRLTLTEEGKKAVQKGTSRMGKLARMMLKELDDEDKQLCIQLLKSTEAKFSVLLPKQKNKKFDDIYEENMG